MRLYKIGRDVACDIKLHSDKISSLHAELIQLNNGDMLLEDKGSKNGTYIMNKPIKPGILIPIRRGDAIRFADVELGWSMIGLPQDLSGYKAVYGIGKNTVYNDIVINGNTVSRFHATLMIDKNGKVYIQDHSTNGTTVNGTRIPSHQSVRLKYHDAVVCGGVPVDLKKYIKTPFPIVPVVSSMIAAAVIVLCVLFGRNLVSGSPKDYIQSTALVKGSYYYTVKLKDDPFVNNDIMKTVFQKCGISWPTTFKIGINDNGEYGLYDGKNYGTIGYQGTAFFVSEDGKLLTNRHVALPWTSIQEQTVDEINQTMAVLKREYLKELIVPILGQIVEFLGQNTCNAYIDRFRNSDIEISGRHDYIAIGYAGYNYNTFDEFARCTVIADSEDDNIDLAVLQLNTKKTPDDIKYIVDVENAVTDSKKLTPLEEDFYYIGYPSGIVINYNPLEGGLMPMMNKVSLAKKPGKYNMELQSEVKGGASGSPIIDKHGHLVGVISARSTLITTLSYAVLAKHAQELLKRTE